MKNILKSIIVNENVSLNGVVCNKDKIYINFILKAHILSENEIVLEGYQIGTNIISFNTLSNQREYLFQCSFTPKQEKMYAFNLEVLANIEKMI